MTEDGRIERRVVQNNELFEIADYRDGVEIFWHWWGPNEDESPEPPKEIVVPAEIEGRPVRRVARSGYPNNRDFQTIVLPEGIESIGECAFGFYFSDERTSIKLPNSLSQIEGNELSCADEIVVPKSHPHFQLIDGVLFSKDLKRVVSYPNARTETEYRVPDSVEVVGKSAFEGNDFLEKIALPKGLKIIEERGLSVDQFAEFDLPDGLAEIGDFAFNKVKSLVVPPSVLKIGGGALNRVERLTLRDNPNYIVVDGVVYSRDLKTVVCFPKNRRTDYYRVPDGVETIGRAAFANNDHIRRVRLPESLKSIKEDAFFGSGLESFRAPEGLEILEICAIECCHRLKEVVLPRALEKLEPFAFLYDDELETVRLPDRITEIDECVFEGCRKLKRVDLPETIESIGESAFQNCESLETIRIPASVKTVDELAFSSCNSLREVVFSEGLERIETWAFANCPALKKVVLPKSVREVAENAFDKGVIVERAN